MEINRNNYEAYLLDLFEDRLTVEDQQKVRDFLILNPDCASEMVTLDPWILEQGKIIYPGKEQLKKELPDSSFKLTETNFDLFSIARLEGDLTQEQVRDHASMVDENEEKMKEWAQWQQTKLKATPIIYTEKNRLKRKKGISGRIIWMSIISSAAVIALLIALLRIDPAAPASDDPIFQKEIAVVSPQIELSSDEGKPVLFSIKKNPDRQEASEIDVGFKDTGSKSDTINMVLQKEVQSRPIRIAGHLSGNRDLVKVGEYDHIQSLEIPSTSIHLSSLSLSQLSEVDLKEIFDDYTKGNEISLWTIANAGFKGINRLTGSEMSLLAARDDEGDVLGFSFKSRRFSFATPLNRSE